MWDKADCEQPIEQVGAELRERMAWLQSRNAGSRGSNRNRNPEPHDVDRRRNLPRPTSRHPSRARGWSSRRWSGRASKCVFGYPGGAIMPVYDALTGSSLKHILVRHEQAAAFAADAYARVTGKRRRLPGDLGSGRDQPGHRHRQRDAGFACRWSASPARSPRRLMGTDAFQEVDILGRHPADREAQLPGPQHGGHPAASSPKPSTSPARAARARC